MTRIDIFGKRVLEESDHANHVLDTEANTIFYAGRAGSGTKRIPEYLMGLPEDAQRMVVEAINEALEANSELMPEGETARVKRLVQASVVAASAVDIGGGQLGYRISPRTFLG